MDNVPELRFFEFFGKWDSVTIQSLIDNKIITGHLDGNHGELYPRSEEFSLDGIPYISANDLDGRNVNLKNSKRLPKKRADKFKKGIAKTGDVLFAHNATVGPTALLKTDFDYVILSTTVTYYRCDLEKLNNSFLLASFNTQYFIKQYSRVMSQSTRNQVPITTQRKFYLSLPTLPEQQKIATFLSAVDKKLGHLRRKHKLLESYKRGVMQKIFAPFDSAQGKPLRFKCFDKLSTGRSKVAEPVEAFPDWEEKRLGDVVDVIDGDRGTNYPKSMDFFEHEFCLFLNAKNVTKKGFLFKEKQFITSERDNLLRNGKLAKQDIILTTRGSVGHFAFYSGSVSFENIRINSGMVILRKKDSSLTVKYLYTVCRSMLIKNQIRVIAFGSAQPQLTVKEIKKLKIPLPCKEEQQKIANFLSALDKKLEAVQKQIDQTETFKKGLLQKMFV